MWMVTYIHFLAVGPELYFNWCFKWYQEMDPNVGNHGTKLSIYRWICCYIKLRNRDLVKGIQDTLKGSHILKHTEQHLVNSLLSQWRIKLCRGFISLSWQECKDWNTASNTSKGRHFSDLCSNRKTNSHSQWAEFKIHNTATSDYLYMFEKELFMTCFMEWPTPLLINTSEMHST